MADYTSLNNLPQGEIVAWLRRALSGLEVLPRLAPDEPAYLGVIRLEESLDPPTRRFLRLASIELVQSFCERPLGSLAYVNGLLQLAASLRLSEVVPPLSALAAAFPSEFPEHFRLAVLATLVDTPPAQPRHFWYSIWQKDPEKFSGIALSGLFAIDPMRAIEMFPHIQDLPDVAASAVLKLDLIADEMPPRMRFELIDATRAIVASCSPHVAAELRNWLASRGEQLPIPVQSSIRTALREFLGQDSAPRARTPKLCAGFTS